MKPQIIGIVGPIRAGKSLAAKYLEKHHGYTIGANSKILKDIASNLSLQHTRDNLKAIGDSIFKVLGNDTIAIHRLRKPEDWPIVIEGIRYIEEVTTYQSEPSFKLLGLKCDEDTRYARMLTLVHEGKDNNINLKAFAQLSTSRSEAQVNELVQRADFIIENNSTVGALYAQLDQIMAVWAAS